MKRILLFVLLVPLLSFASSASAYVVATCNGVPIERSNLIPQFRVNVLTGGSPTGEFDEAIWVFNRNPTNMKYWSDIHFFLGGSVGLNNGHTEVWSIVEITDADIFNGDQFAAVAFNWLDGCDIDEGDVVFNLAYEWNAVSQKSDYNAYGDNPTDLSTTAAAIHELGHTLGFEHDCSTYNVMGDAFDHFWANGPDAGEYLGEGVIDGLIALYGDEGPAVLQSPDVAVAHWRYDSCAVGGYSVHERTGVFDLAGDPLATVSGETEPRFVAAAGQTVEPFFTFENLGNTLEEGVEIGFYYSDNDTITTLDRRLGGTTLDFVRNEPDTRRYAVDLPLDLAQGDGYLGVIVDEIDAINEGAESNNATYIGMRIEGQDFDGDGNPDDGSERFYRYAAKVVCGVQVESDDLRLRPGVYATTVNILNPDVETVRFDKRLAVSYPPDPQRQGETYEFGFDSLDPLHALETDCDDLIDKAFDGVPPQPYFEGFVVITSPASLDVTAVYSGTGILTEVMESQSGPDDTVGGFTTPRRCSKTGCGGCCPPCCGGCCGGPGDGDGGGGGGGDGGGGGGAGASLTLDVEQIKERKVTGMPPPDGEEEQADLIPVPGTPTHDFHPETAFCQRNASGELLVTVRNQGAAQAQASVTTVTYAFDDTPILRATAVLGPAGHPIDEIVVPFPMSNECFMPSPHFGVSCLFNIEVDSGSHVSESNEGNNTAFGVCIAPAP